jgi:carbonic anhydrase/acetyltransferase-like protein (isoleucine patch superfamily)
MLPRVETGAQRPLETTMPVYKLRGDVPQIPASAFIAPEATLIGKVKLGEGTGIWFGAVLRGDNELISVGAGSNVQEGVVLHTDPGFPLTIGANVTIGHQAMLHGCTIGDGSLIGIQAVVMNGAVIGRECLIGAGAIVTEGKQFPDRSLILGAPAKVVRELTEQDLRMLKGAADSYIERSARYRTSLTRVDTLTPDRP